MKLNNLTMLALALSTTLFAAGCNRDADTAGEPATSADSMPADAMPVEPAVAPEPAPAPAAAMADSGMSFADMDKNSDGGIAHDELADGEMLDQHFSTADTDGDGKLSAAEVDAHRADMAANPGG